ncbi:hypothetical protein A0U95_03035 [Pseudomonas brassicacearum]|nr:hypothetical protein A0U95_03035 [Pseudomonas brassicacearum]
MTADIQHQGRLTHRYREQALLPLGIFVGREIAGWHRSKPWEQSLLAMTADIQHQGRLTRCYREQALLPLGIFVGREIAGWHRSKPWEQSLLAMTADIQHQGRLTRCYREQALLPLGIFVGREIAGWHRSKLWEQSLLAMTAAHPTSRQTDTPLSRASFAPTGDFCWQGNRRLAPIQTVGAKLARDDGGTSNIKAD